VAAEIKSGKLVRVLESFEPPPQTVHLVTPSSRVTPKVRAFLDHAIQALQKLDVLRESSPHERRPVASAGSKRSRR
jgi:DNA-binding transcriptional LysR family regulator